MIDLQKQKMTVVLQITCEQSDVDKMRVKVLELLAQVLNAGLEAPLIAVKIEPKGKGDVV